MDKVPSRLVIFGAGKIAEQAYAYLASDSPHEVAAFTVDAAYRDGDEKLGLPLVSFEEVAERFPPATHRMFVAVGYQGLNSLRAARCDAARSMGYDLVSYISSRASVVGDVEIGDNCFIGEFAAIQPGARIGDDVYVFGGSYVGHHASIGDHCYLAANTVIAGGTRIDPYCFLGITSTIGHEVTVGRESFIGAGALITKDVAPRSVHIVADTPRYRLDAPSFLRLTKMQ
jgi:sugar O-acyltransferase (sialic acid O-acetyltransferase NeuD family)